MPGTNPEWAIHLAFNLAMTLAKKEGPIKGPVERLIEGIGGKREPLGRKVPES